MSQEQEAGSENKDMTRRGLLAAAGATGIGAIVTEGATAQEQAEPKRKFKPNSCTFEQGVEAVKKAVEQAGFDPNAGIITSRDDEAKKVREELEVNNIPNGFSKHQLPFILDRAQLYISVGSPNLKVPRHSHDEGNGIRVIVHGSIRYEGKELTSGDWMWIPKGKPYSFEVGEHGATMFYCYECCCR